MKVDIKLESLKQTTNGHDKGYQMLKLTVDDVPRALLRIYGPNAAPQHADFGMENVDSAASELLKKKLKHYVRLHTPLEHGWRGAPELFVTGGYEFILQMIQENGIWREITPQFKDKLKVAIKGIAAQLPATFWQEETEVEDLFRTREERNKARIKMIQEQREIEQLSNWGAF